MKKKAKPARKQARKPAPKKKTSTALAIRQTEALEPATPKGALQISNPQVVLDFGRVLKKYIVENKLSVMINGNDYAMVSAWQFAGSSFGLDAVVENPIKEHQSGEYITILYEMKTFYKKDKTSYRKPAIGFIGFEKDTDVIERQRKRMGSNYVKEETKPHFKYSCKVNIVRTLTKEVLSSGSAVCSNLEELKATFTESAIMSMVQTRAIGKAYRNKIGFIMKSAGYQDTPAEEMSDVHQDAEVVETSPKESPKVKYKLDDVDFQKAVKKISEGEKDKKWLRDNAELTETQKAIIDKL